jgi:hypothetical protein
LCIVPRRSRFRRVDKGPAPESAAMNSDLFGPYYFSILFEVNRAVRPLCGLLRAFALQACPPTERQPTFQIARAAASSPE